MIIARVTRRSRVCRAGLPEGTWLTPGIRGARARYAEGPLELDSVLLIRQDAGDSPWAMEHYFYLCGVSSIDEYEDTWLGFATCANGDAGSWGKLVGFTSEMRPFVMSRGFVDCHARTKDLDEWPQDKPDKWQ